MSESSDPRYGKWRQVVRVWRKSLSHLPSDPIPVAPDEDAELREIFGKSFAFPDGTVAYGKPGNQRFVIIGLR